MKVVNREEFEKLLQTQKYVVADFFANWCMPCKMLAPVLDELASDYPQIAFCKIDVDQEDQLALKYKIDFIPNVIFFVNGAKKDSFTGFKSKEELTKILDLFIG